MKFMPYAMLCLCALLPAGGFADVKITEQQTLVTEKIPKPAQIWVHDFVATPKDLPADSTLAEHPEVDHDTPQTDEQIAAGRKVGADVAAQLVMNIQAMGMPAEHATDASEPQINDIVIRGYLVSVIAGDKKKRVALGFGKGESELKVAAEGFQMTADGLRKLGSGSSDATSSKKPGGALGVVGIVAMHNPVGLIVSTGMKQHDEKTGKSTLEGRAKDTADAIAKVLKERFQEQGWVQ